jgi:methyl-accepting chemotaxis protein
VRAELNRWLGNRSVATKLATLCALLLSVAAVIGLVGLRSIEVMTDRQEEMFRSAHQAVLLGRMDHHLMNLRADLRDHILAEDAAAERRFQAGIDASDEELQVLLDELREMGAGRNGARELAVIETFTSELETYQNLRDEQVLRLSSQGQKREAYRNLQSAAVPPYQKATRALQDFVVMQTEVLSDSHRAAKRTGGQSEVLLLLTLLLGGMLGTSLAFWIVRLIVAALRRVSAVAEGLAVGDLTRISGVDTHDEIGQMAQGLDKAMAVLRESIGALSASAHALADTSEELTSISTRLGGTADETAQEASRVSAAADQISQHVQTLATGTEEMGASIREIAHSASDAAQIGSGAVDRARSANATITRLGESSTQISGVIKLITSVAEQTNLLALNATIEAARAGEAGKGFAVVAGEVKDLAQETARAANDIGELVESIQRDTVEAVTEIGEVGAVIEQLGGYQTTIASAVEEQTSTTNEMNRSVSEASTGAEEIAGNITLVARGAHATTGGVNEAARVAEELSRMSTGLTGLVSRFTF